MARTHSRPSSPDVTSSIKRLKSSHSSMNGSALVTSVADVTSSFAADVLDHSNIAKLHKSYLDSEPFRYALVEKLFQDDLLKKVKDECLSELSFTEKETDIYKVNQTGDLASLNYLTSSQISLLPNLLKLRDALYSPTFRAFLRSVTGCGPLSGTKQDMSVNSYTKGCHLLNHDDVIGTRRVSYILYMPLPHYQFWQRDWGGALELYPTKPGRDGVPEPECVPSKSIPPSWNQFIFFEVQPGQSFHSVEEVVVGSGEEDGRVRLSISGWFHSAQEGEEGYEPPVDAADLKSSRDQLADTQTEFKAYSLSEKPPLPDAELSEEQVTFLSEYLNPVYLQPRTMKSLASRFVEESSLELHSFLSNSLADALEPRLRELDAKDGLGPDRNGRVPPHGAGVDAINPDIVHPNGTTSSYSLPSLNTSVIPPLSPVLSPVLTPNGVNGIPTNGISPNGINGFNGVNGSSIIGSSLNNALNGITISGNGTTTNGTSKEEVKAPSAWTLRGPPHKWRYCTLTPPDPSAPATSVTPLSAHPSPSEILRTLQDELFPSQAFRAWLAIVSRLLPLRHSVEARRFRPGLDYTLATSEESEARLDVVLGLTPDVKDEDEKNFDSNGRRRPEAPPVRGWSAAEWGGWECYMAPHNEEDDPAVYRAGTYKRSDALKNGHKPPQTTNDNGNGASANGESSNHTNGNHMAESPEPFEEDGDDMAMEDEDEEEDSTLLTVQPGFNRLLLVLRDERVMRFVKYVSAAAEGSRWDVCAEYEVGMMQEDGED